MAARRKAAESQADYQAASDNFKKALADAGKVIDTARNAVAGFGKRRRLLTDIQAQIAKTKKAIQDYQTKKAAQQEKAKAAADKAAAAKAAWEAAQAASKKEQQRCDALIAEAKGLAGLVKK